MALDLPPLLKIAKNEVASLNPWLVLLDVVLPDGTPYYFVHNKEDVLFEGRTYTRTRLQIELPEISSEANIPTWTIRVDNILRALQFKLQALSGAVDSDVTVRFVNSGLLSENYSGLTVRLKVLKAGPASEQWVPFTCGGRNLLASAHPFYRFLATHCMWNFKWHECNYFDATASVILASDANDYVCYVPHRSDATTEPLVGERWMQVWRRKDRKNAGGSGSQWLIGADYTSGTATCKNNLDDCRDKGNSLRFGGFVGLSRIGVRLV